MSEKTDQFEQPEQPDFVNITLKLEGAEAAAFLKFKAAVHLKQNSEVTRQLVMPRLIDLGYLPKPPSPTATEIVS